MRDIPVNLGAAVKSRIGTGILFTIKSHKTSRLKPICADIGIIGAVSATVPAGNNYKNRIKSRTARII